MRHADVPGGVRQRTGEFRIDREDLALDAREARALQRTLVLRERVSLRTEPVLDTGAREVRLFARRGKVGMVDGEHEPAARHEHACELRERPVEVAQVLADERAEHGVETGVLEREPRVQVGDRELRVRTAPPRDREHAGREIDARDARSGGREAHEIAPRAAARVEDALSRARHEVRERVAFVERDERVRRRVVVLGPEVVPLAHAHALDARRALGHAREEADHTRARAVLAPRETAEEVVPHRVELRSAERAQERHAFEPRAPRVDHVRTHRSVTREFRVVERELAHDLEPGGARVGRELAPHVEVVAACGERFTRVLLEELPRARGERRVAEEVVDLGEHDPGTRTQFARPRREVRCERTEIRGAEAAPESVEPSAEREWCGEIAAAEFDTCLAACARDGEQLLVRVDRHDTGPARGELRRLIADRAAEVEHALSREHGQRVEDTFPVAPGVLTAVVVGEGHGIPAGRDKIAARCASSSWHHAARMELRVATCRVLPEPDPDEELLLAALHARGVGARMAAWNDPGMDWDARVPTLIRSTWDYLHDVAAFRAWIDRAERAAPLWNAARVVLGNLHKDYLLALQDRGVPVVPTVLVRRGAERSLAALARERDWNDLVVKPAVGAGSFETRRFRGHEFADAERCFADAVRARDTLVQPYVASVDGHGERALVWIAGAFTHAVRKSPRFSGDDECVSEAVAIEADERALGELALAPLARELLYARVDVARDADGRPRIMELELVEPSLFLAQHPPALARFADEIARRVADPWRSGAIR